MQTLGKIDIDRGIGMGGQAGGVEIGERADFCNMGVGTAG